jgi:hypothetical protein
MITGKGTAKAKIARNDKPAMIQWDVPLSARLATLANASITMAMTAALTPRNAASTQATCPK